MLDDLIADLGTVHTWAHIEALGGGGYGCKRTAKRTQNLRKTADDPGAGGG